LLETVESVSIAWNMS